MKNTFSKGQPIDSKGQSINPDWITKVSYLRGLDGRLPGQKNSPQAIGAVIAYRSTAENARRVACRHLSNRIIAAKGRGADATAEQLEKLLADMQELREGAFAPWTSQPVVGAVLLPLITYGGTWLLHIYALPGI